MINITNNKGLAQWIMELTNKEAEVYYKRENKEVIVYWLGNNVSKLKWLHLNISDYIDENCMFSCYTKVSIHI